MLGPVDSDVSLAMTGTPFKVGIRERSFIDQAAATSTASGLNKERFRRIVSSTMSPH
jgi:hypothetical protein